MFLTRTITAERLQFAVAGSWTAAHADRLEQLVEEAARGGADTPYVAIDMAGVDELDTLGAWLLERLSRSPDLAGKETRFTGLNPRYRGLIEEMHRVNRPAPTRHAGLSRPLAALDEVGRAAVGLISDLVEFLQLFGELSVAIGRILMHPRRFRLTSAVIICSGSAGRRCRSWR
jgi:phospholipid/cholesterol/gamma-HCH transport system permease protein